MTYITKSYCCCCRIQNLISVLGKSICFSVVNTVTTNCTENLLCFYTLKVMFSSYSNCNWRVLHYKVLLSKFTVITISHSNLDIPQNLNIKLIALIVLKGPTEWFNMIYIEPFSVYVYHVFLLRFTF